MTDTYLNLVNSGFTKTLAKQLGLPRPAPLRRHRPGEPLVTGPVLVIGLGGQDGASTPQPDADALAQLLAGPRSTGSTSGTSETPGWDLDVHRHVATTETVQAVVLVLSDVEHPDDLAAPIAALAPVLRPLRGARKAWGAQVTIDESTAVALAQPHDDVAARREGFWWTGVGVFIFWNAFTLVGAGLGSALGDPGKYGLDAAAAAAFLALLWPRLAPHRAKVVAGVAAIVALVLTPVVPAGIPILAAAVVAVVAGWSAPPPTEEVPE